MTGGVTLNGESLTPLTPELRFAPEVENVVVALDLGGGNIVMAKFKWVKIPLQVTV